LTVFYDAYEQANLWGKELAGHLDSVYRKESRVCIVLVSKDYARKAWTRHEVRSILARAMRDDDGEDYLLPVRIDDTDLLGLSPTIGYLDARVLDAQDIVRLLCEKLGLQPEASIRHHENIVRLRDMRMPCSAFVIDRRYVQDRDDPAVEHRLALSFGANITDTFGTILAPPRQQGPYVLALHVVSTERGLLYPVDKWYDSRSYGAELSQTAATAAASVAVTM